MLGEDNILDLLGDLNLGEMRDFANRFFTD